MFSKEKMTMICALMIVCLSSSVFATTLFRDDFDSYPGSNWNTYANPANPDYKAEVAPGADFLYVGFGNSAVANAAITVAGQDGYASPKTVTGDVYIAYTIGVSKISGWNSGVDIYVSAQQEQASIGYDGAGPGRFRLKLKRNNASELLVVFYGPYYKSHGLVDMPTLNDEGVTMDFTMKLNDSSYEIYADNTLVVSGSHSADMTTWNTNAYMSINEWSQFGTASPLFSQIDYAEISQIPEPMTIVMMGLGAFGVFRKRKV